LHQHAHPPSRKIRALRVCFLFLIMTRIPFTQPATDFNNQLETLKRRGLIINNESKFLHLLEHISYFRLSAYWYPLLSIPKSAKNFKPDSNFDKVFKLYCFDRKLRRLILTELEKVEIAIRAKMNNVLSLAHSPFWFCDATLFNDAGLHTDTLRVLSQEVRRSDEVFIHEFINNFTDTYPPSWMILEIASFGTISKLYKNLKPNPSKREIANHFGLDESTFESWFHTMTYIRNACAHHARIWNKQISIRPQIPRTTTKLWLRSGTINNQRIYFVLSSILFLLQTVDDKNVFTKRLFMLLIRFPNTDLSAMGFPLNWKEEPLWKISRWRFLLFTHPIFRHLIGNVFSFFSR
jgi:abortive infection bacteriophage resistance protein